MAQINRDVFPDGGRISGIASVMSLNSVAVIVCVPLAGVIFNDCHQIKIFALNSADCKSGVYANYSITRIVLCV